MREFSPVINYPSPKQKRWVGPKDRSISNRITASYRDQRFYDGERNDGYGGFSYDGRWIPTVKNMQQVYDLGERARILQIGCEKGFILRDFREIYPRMEVVGTETSSYARLNAESIVANQIENWDPNKLKVSDHSFDFVLAMGVVYTLNLSDAIMCLKEIERVGKGKSYITLGAYRNAEEEKLMRSWSLLGTTILHEEEWREVLTHAGYSGDYAFVTSRSLNLAWRNE